MDRRTVRRSPAVHSYRGQRMLLDVAVGLLGRWQARSSPIKRSPPFSSRSCPGLSRRRRHCWQPRRSSGPGWLCTQENSPPPSLAPTLAPNPPSRRRNPTSPAHRPQRPPRLAAGAPSLPAPSRPKRARKSTPSARWNLPRPRPAGLSRRFAGIWPDRRRPAPRDPIAR
jgi:hypothetical protein